RPGACPVRRVVDPDPVRGFLHPVRPRPPLRAALTLGDTKAQVTALKNPPDRGWVSPEPSQPRPAMGELAVRPVDVGPVVEHRDDLVLFGGCEPVRRVPARRRVIEPRTDGDTVTPAFEPPLRQLQIAARLAGGPAAGLGVFDQIDQRGLGGRVDPPWD